MLAFGVWALLAGAAASSAKVRRNWAGMTLRGTLLKRRAWLAWLKWSVCATRAPDF